VTLKRDSVFDNLILQDSSSQCLCGYHLSTEGDRISQQKTRLLGIAFGLVFGFAVVEIAIGRFTHSIALQAEAKHMMLDSLSLAVSFVAATIARFRQDNRRIEALAASINAIGLVAIAIEIAFDAIVSLQSPPKEILSLTALITACVALAINLINVTLLHDSSHQDLNVRAAFIHIVMDVIGSVSVIVATFAVWHLHWLWADGAIGLFLSGAIVWSAIPLMVKSIKHLQQSSKK
jgi:cobalt-zinc-cadmium efflux system protein